MLHLIRPALIALFVALPHGPWPGGAAVTASPRPPAPTADCNDNGVEDAVDIAIGYSSDLDGNGVPDECELAPADRSEAEIGSAAANPDLG